MRETGSYWRITSQSLEKLPPLCNELNLISNFRFYFFNMILLCILYLIKLSCFFNHMIELKLVFIMLRKQSHAWKLKINLKIGFPFECMVHGPLL